MQMQTSTHKSKEQYFQNLTPSYFKWLQESLLCFDLTIPDQILTNQIYFKNFLDLLSINDHMNDLVELVGLTSSTELLKESFKILDESFRVSD